jgi:hypothetical protein
MSTRAVATDPIPDPPRAYDRNMENADSHPVADVPEDYDSVGDVRPSSPVGGNEDEGPANPSSEAEDRNKSPQGGRPVDDHFDDDEVAVDPEDAMTANGFISLITVVMLVLVVLVVVTALTGSTIMLVVTFLGIMTGLALVLKNLFQMMSTD